MDIMLKRILELKGKCAELYFLPFLWYAPPSSGCLQYHIFFPLLQRHPAAVLFLPGGFCYVLYSFNAGSLLSVRTVDFDMGQVLRKCERLVHGFKL